jgi:histone acetyltransferase (RNA polymerase elongator complex component)
MSDNILKRAKRGHSSVDIKKASRLILKYGFGLGHQLMVGLPASMLRDEIAAAKLSIQLGASEVRIYPVIVMKGTELARVWKNGRYRPLTEEEAIKRCAKLIRLFEGRNVRVIRCGLHPSDGLLSGKEIVAGPFHEAFRQKVETHIYLSLFKDLFNRVSGAKAVKNIYYNPVDAAYIIGYERSNAKYIETMLKRRDLFNTSRSVRPKSVKIKFEDGETAVLMRGGQEDVAAP